MIVVALMLFSGSMPAVAADVYRNAKLGFSFELPKGTVRCAPDPGTGPEHGTALWLDGNGGECSMPPDRPRLAVMGAYNSMFWASPKAALQELCKRGDVVKPPRLEYKTHPSAVCKVVLANGWIEIELAIMTGIWPPPYHEPEDSSPLMLYTVYLHTTPARERKDMQRMQAVAKSLRIFEPQ